jgi:hypothetical protein
MTHFGDSSDTHAQQTAPAIHPFHPDFATPHPDAKIHLIIETEDHTRFLFPRSKLEQASSFFQGIHSLVVDPNQPIDLPRASGDQLAVILDAIFHPIKELFPAPRSLQLVRHYRFALRRTADAYDFEPFAAAVVGLVENGVWEDPYARFAVAVMLDSQPLIEMTAGKTLSLDWSGLNHRVGSALRGASLEQYHAIWKLHQVHDKMRIRFRRQLVSSWPMYNSLDHFGKVCQGMTIISIGPCASYMTYGGDFAEMRKHAATMAWTVISTQYLPADKDAEGRLDVGLQDLVVCHRCRTRLSRTFFSALKLSPDRPRFADWTRMDQAGQGP